MGSMASCSSYRPIVSDELATSCCVVDLTVSDALGPSGGSPTTDHTP